MWYPQIPPVIFGKLPLASQANLNYSKDLRDLLAKTEQQKKSVPHKLLKRICNHRARERNQDLFPPNRLHVT